MKTYSCIKWILGAGTIAGALAFTAGPITAATAAPAAADPFGAQAIVVPVTGRTETAIPADDKPGVVARSHAARTSLGMPGGVTTKAVHVKDASRGLEYDEVTDIDAGGQPVAMTELDGSGHLLLAVRFDQLGKTKVPVGHQSALNTASKGLGAAGVAVSDQPVVDETTSLGGWDVTWPRTSAGVPVLGDEIRVHVRDDGAIGSVGQVTHDLAAAPAVRLTRSQALAVAGSQVQAWSARSGAKFVIGDASMEWAGPNAAFDPSKIGAADQPYRLSWVVKVTPQGDAASVVRLVVLYIDAGDGSVIGGDVVE